MAALSYSPSLVAFLAGCGYGSVAITFRQGLAVYTPDFGARGSTPVQKRARLLRCGPAAPEAHAAKSFVWSVHSLASQARDKALPVVTKLPSPMFLNDRRE